MIFLGFVWFLIEIGIASFCYFPSLISLVGDDWMHFEWF